MKAFVKIMISLGIPIFIVLIKPLGFNLEQAAIFGVFILVLFWWATAIVPQRVASLTLLAGFLIFGGSPGSVFAFPTTSMFVLIVCSYLLTAGIVTSGVAAKISAFFIEKYCKNIHGLILAAFLTNIALIFLIPQPFPRVLIIGEIFVIALSGSNLVEKQKQIVMYSIFMAGSVTTLLLLNSDILANYVAFELAGVGINSIKWFKYMTLPTTVATAAVGLGFIVVFGKDLKGSFEKGKEQLSTGWENKGKTAVAIMCGVVGLWILEPLHHIAPAYIALGGVAAMLCTAVIKIADFRKINITLLIFMTAQFAIGRVFMEKGITPIIKDSLMKVIPPEDSWLYIPVIVLAVMALHMLLGSIVTVLSITVPPLVMLTSGVLSPEIIAFLVCAATSFHVFLPYHQVTTMVGFQQKYYDTSLMIKFGWYLTLITLLLIIFVYCPWWKLIGVMA